MRSMFFQFDNSKSLALAHLHVLPLAFTHKNLRSQLHFVRPASCWQSEFKAQSCYHRAELFHIYSCVYIYSIYIYIAYIYIYICVCVCEFKLFI